MEAGIGLSLLSVMFSAASAADPIGSWITEVGAATARVATCGSELCGTITSLKESNDPATGRPKTDKSNPDAAKQIRPLAGTQIVFGMKPSGTPNKWKGQVYNAEDGKTYSGSLTLQSASTLKLEGFVLGGPIYKSQTWTRGG